MLLNSPSPFIKLLRRHPAQEARVVFLCHVFKAEIPFQFWVPAEIPVFLPSSRNRTRDIRHQTRHEIMLSSIPQHQTRRHEIKCKIVSSLPSILIFFYSFQTSKKFKLTYHLSSQEELITSLTGALNNKIRLSCHFLPSS